MATDVGVNCKVAVIFHPSFHDGPGGHGRRKENGPNNMSADGVALDPRMLVTQQEMTFAKQFAVST